MKKSKTQSEIDQPTEFQSKNDPLKNYGMIIDLNKCNNCSEGKFKTIINTKTHNIEKYENNCTAACRQMHNVPPEQEWIKIYFRQDNPLDSGYWFPRVCMQCENPPCVNVCPVQASFRREKGDGLVLVDHNKCIGCRLCMAACPYEVRYFNWEEYDEPNKDIIELDSPMYITKHIKGTVGKCDFCAHMAYEGNLPACVSACKNGALYYGNLKENAVTNSKGETLDVAKTIDDLDGFRYREDFNTQPRVFYIPRRKK